MASGDMCVFEGERAENDDDEEDEDDDDEEDDEVRVRDLRAKQRKLPRVLSHTSACRLHVCVLEAHSSTSTQLTMSLASS